MECSLSIEIYAKSAARPGKPARGRLSSVAFPIAVATSKSASRTLSFKFAKTFHAEKSPIDGVISCTVSFLARIQERHQSFLVVTFHSAPAEVHDLYKVDAREPLEFVRRKAIVTQKQIGKKRYPVAVWHVLAVKLASDMRACLNEPRRSMGFADQNAHMLCSS